MRWTGRKGIPVLFLHRQVILAHQALKMPLSSMFRVGRSAKIFASLPNSSAVLNRSLRACQETLDTFSLPSRMSFEHPQQHRLPRARRANDDKTLLRGVDRDETVSQHLLEQRHLRRIPSHGFRQKLLESRQSASLS